MARRRKALGIDALVLVNISYLYPSRLIRDKFPNRVKGQRWDDLRWWGQEIKTVQRKEVLCAVMMHDDFDESELYCLSRCCKITRAGPEEYIFDVQEKNTGQGDNEEDEDAVDDSELQVDL